jgi:hypothetical protein
MNKHYLLAVSIVLALLHSSAVEAQIATIPDGGFEQGLAPWSPRGSVAAGAFAKPHSGQRFATFGVGSDGRPVAFGTTGSIEQVLSVPSSPNLVIAFWVWITSEETDPSVRDTVTVQLRDLAGSVLETRVISNLDKSGDYLRHVIPVAKYANKSVRLSFLGFSNATKTTIFRLDDVAFAQGVNPVLSIVGTVTDGSTGAGIVGATFDFGGSQTRSGAGGAYSLANVPCQVGTLNVSAPGYQSFSQSGYAPNCFGGMNIRNVALVPRPTTLSGRVTDAWSGLPMIGVRVQLGAQFAITNSKGVFGMTLPNCQAGTLTATAVRFKPYAAPYTPTCRADNIQNITFAPEATSFTVSTDDGATVTWNGQSPLTVNRGVAVFAGVPCQSATLVVTLTGYETASVPYKPICDESSFVTITLQPKLTHFSGVVTVAGSPVPIPATLEWNNIQTPTAPDGSYSFWAVPCTSATLTVTANGFLRSKQLYAPSCDSNNIKNIFLAVAPTTGTYVCGMVINPTTGRGVGSALLTLGNTTTYSQADGSYCLARVPCGSSTLWTQATSYPTLGEPLAPTCGKVLMHDVTLPPWAVNGRVEDYVTGEPIPGVPVQWQSKTLISSWDGAYGFTGCGDAPVVITWPGYLPYQYQGVTCKIGISTSYEYAGLRVATDRSALLVSSYLGGRVEFQGQIATPTQSGYLLSNLPCNTTGTLIVSAARYQEAHLPYVTSCGTTDQRDITLLQKRTFVWGVVLSGATRIQGALVTWGTYSATTNDRGNYLFDNVPCGQTEMLVVTKAGYRDFSKSLTAPCPGRADGSVQITR